MADPARLLRLLSLFQARQEWTAPELAERLGVTTRTVRRDVTRLRDLGYPVDAEPGPHGGYRLGRGTRLPPLLFEPDEAVAVAVGLRLAADGSVAELDDATVSALTKLDQVLPAPLAERVRDVSAVVAQVVGRSPDQVDGTTFFALAQACRAEVRIRLTYRARDGRTTERRADPYRLVRSGPRWYLVAFDVDRAAWRTFRMDRVVDVAATRQRVELVDPPDAVALVARGMAVEPYAVAARLRLAASAAEAEAVIARTVGVHEPDGDATVVTVGGPDIEAMARWISSLGVEVEVLAPPELRTAVRRRAQALAAANRGRPPG